MIASLHGTISHKTQDKLVINVGGVGVEVFATRTGLDQGAVGDGIDLYTRLIVREDALTLYGFGGASERDLFDILIKINGVGPKLALVILSTLSINNLRQAVINERVEVLTHVPGIGKKTAQKILLELRDKLPVGLDALPAEDDTPNMDGDVMDALLALGFSVVEAQSAIQSLPPDASKDIDERIRLSLQVLSR
jgi:Holliday junction DNA helicase RuvA